MPILEKKNKQTNKNKKQNNNNNKNTQPPPPAAPPPPPPPKKTKQKINKTKTKNGRIMLGRCPAIRPAGRPAGPRKLFLCAP